MNHPHSHWQGASTVYLTNCRPNDRLVLGNVGLLPALLFAQTPERRLKLNTQNPKQVRSLNPVLVSEPTRSSLEHGSQPTPADEAPLSLPGFGPASAGRGPIP